MRKKNATLLRGGAMTCLTRWLGRLALPACLAVGSVCASAQTQEGCMYQVPSPWQSLPVQWIGECHEIYADGLGVLQVTASPPEQVFYGQLSRGQAQQGVLEQPSGLQPGRFIKGVWVPARGREERAEAWQIGIEAARKTSAHFREAGIGRLAEAYEAAAQRLDKQAARSR